MAKTVKDDKQKRPLWMKRHDPRPPSAGAEGRGGHKNLEQLLGMDPTWEKLGEIVEREDELDKG